MPRPPLSRPARTRPTKTTNDNDAPAPALESAPKSNGSSSDIYNVSDREKERAAARRKSLRDRAMTAETTQQQKELDKAKQRRDAAMNRLQNITSTDNSDEEVGGAAQDSNSPPAPSQRVEATPLRRRVTDASGLDLDDSMFDDLNTTLDTVGHTSAQRSAETSTLSVSRFSRRPRNGSFLSRDDGPIRPSSRAGPNTPGFSSTLNFGVFKRRQREPSILSSVQKPRSQRPEPEQEPADDEDEDGDEDGLDEDGFAPEAESTPVRRSKRGSGEAGHAQAISSAESRKRKSTEGHEQRVRSSPFEVHDIRQSIEQPASDEDSPLSSPPLPRHEREPPSTPIAPAMDPALMAPPLSSDSSESDEELWPPLKSIPRARTRQATAASRQTPGQYGGDASDMSSPPSLTHSPNYAHSSSPPPVRAAKPKRKAAPKPPRKMTTADLTGMLPRRRHRGGRDDDPFSIEEDDESEDEVDVSGLGEGDDELGHLDVRTRRRPASSRAANSQNQNKSATKTKTTRATASRKKDDGANATATVRGGGSNKRISRTYGRLSDEENQEEEDEDEDSSNLIANLDEESSQELVERMGEELKMAVRKFQEVDKWELSFEERTRSSSPIDAR
ncbi:hypothetical protein F4777DRAFT_530929 [Nemania sp. FL0916]|nr:hypothetical protein F4777DRAFT_530929 [Nemania sp. FL0916]